MKLYTFVLEFDGGTYIAQHSGQDLEDAIRTYAQAMRASPHLPGEVFAAALVNELGSVHAPLIMRSCLPERQSRRAPQRRPGVCARSTTKSGALAGSFPSGCAQKATAYVTSLAKDRTLAASGALASDLLKRNASFKGA